MLDQHSANISPKTLNDCGRHDQDRYHSYLLSESSPNTCKIAPLLEKYSADGCETPSTHAGSAFSKYKSKNTAHMLDQHSATINTKILNDCGRQDQDRYHSYLLSESSPNTCKIAPLHKKY